MRTRAHGTALGSLPHRCSCKWNSRGVSPGPSARSPGTAPTPKSRPGSAPTWPLLLSRGPGCRPRFSPSWLCCLRASTGFGGKSYPWLSTIRWEGRGTVHPGQTPRDGARLGSEPRTRDSNLFRPVTASWLLVSNLEMVFPASEQEGTFKTTEPCDLPKVSRVKLLCGFWFKPTDACPVSGWTAKQDMVNM